MLRRATREDIPRLAYLVLCWDSELPEFARTVCGDADAALHGAELMCGPKFETWMAVEDGEPVGTLVINRAVSLFGFRSYGQVAGVYVLPKYRGSRMLGLQLLRKAVQLKSELDFKWLEVQPWADDRNTGRVLKRLGFAEATHLYVLR